MNRRKILFSIAAVFAISVWAVASVITVKFVGKNAADNRYVQLDSVAIENLTRNWRQTAIFPDTVMEFTEKGVFTEVAAVNVQKFGIAEVAPNPAEGVAHFNLAVPQAGKIVLSVTDLSGRALLNLEENLPVGVFAYRLTMQVAEAYVVRATNGSETSVVKVINRKSAGETTLTQIAKIDTERAMMKVLKLPENDFETTDEMQYTGYVTVDEKLYISDKIRQTQTADEKIELIFHLCEPIETEFSVAECGEYIWNEISFAASGSYKQTFTAANGCDSVVTLNLTILENCHEGHEYVDFGLPSGLLWATTNVGAATSVATGDYFAWGETAPKANYTWNNYAFGTQDNLTKYNATDGKTVLDLEDDAARVNWQGAWRMPTKEECEELRANCDWEWKDNYNNSGINGCLVKGRGAYSGNSIFLPATGNISGTSISAASAGYSRTSSLHTNSQSAHSLVVIYSLNPNSRILTNNRYFGMPVRAVASSKPTVQTTEVTEIGALTAKVGGKILTAGVGEIIEKGVVYATTENPEIGGAGVAQEPISGEEFATTIAFECGNTYYVRAFATNSFGTVYGEQVTIDHFMPKASEFTEIVCGLYTWNERTYTESGDYTQTFTAANGCDSVVTLHLTILGNCHEGREYVDLGLPSGTQWATTNIGATTPEGLGDHYAWGETTPKADYDWATYTLCASGNENNITKYNTTDGKTVLKPEDDAATANWHGIWRMPTYEELKELKDYCTWTWTANYNETGTKGYIVSSQAAGNTNSIFLPAAGSMSGSSISGSNSLCYWTSSRGGDIKYAIGINYEQSSFSFPGYMAPRFLGYSVRAVMTGKPVVQTEETIETGSLTANVGGEIVSVGVGEITEKGFVYSTTENPVIGGAGVTKEVVSGEEFAATITFECGNIYYVRAFATNRLGTAYGEQITIDHFMPKASEFTEYTGQPYTWNGQTYDESGDYTQTLTAANGCDSVVTLHLFIGTYYEGHAYVDLGLPSGLYWATNNIGAATPDGFGDYFMWGYTEPSTNSECSWTTYTKFGTYDAGNAAAYGFNKYTAKNGDGKIVLEPEDDAARVNWHGVWRMPTYEEFQELQNNCTWTWTTNYNGTGKKGYIVRSLAAGNTNSIFLPLAESREDSRTTTYNEGHYWTATTASGQNFHTAFHFYFTSSYYNASLSFKYMGMSVRAVFKSIPNLQTAAVSNIDENSAVFGGTLIEEGLSAVTEKGFVYSTSTNPTVETGTVVPITSEEFSTTVTDLNPATNYYVRAYATNEYGTAYGEQKEFTTYAATSVSGTIGTHDYVDLGLPSGLYWATTNIGATEPKDYGLYFMWGYTEQSNNYSWTSYTKFGTYDENSEQTCGLIKYNNEDNKTVLDSEDDAAVANWGESWRMPTKEEFDELRTHCTWVWTKNYNGTGVKGYIVKSTAEGNTNSIFLPAAGDGYANTSGRSSGTIARYWSSTLSTESCNTSCKCYANSFFFESSYHRIYDTYRYYGGSVRAVPTGKPKVKEVGETSNVTYFSATLSSEILDEGFSPVTEKGFVYSTNANPTLETDTVVSVTGEEFSTTVAGLNSATNYYVRAYATNSFGTAYSSVTWSITTPDPLNGHEYVDLGLSSGTLWATCNVGATTPEGYGDYFNPQKTYNNKPITDDPARTNWGGEWRTPSKTNFDELKNNCTWTWTTNYNGTGVNGFIVQGPNGNRIFLPVAGAYIGGILSTSPVSNGYDGYEGHYWAATRYDIFQVSWAQTLRIHYSVSLDGGRSVKDLQRYYGVSVRPLTATLEEWPTVKTDTAIKIGNHTAKVSGKVLSIGVSNIIEKGFVYSTSQNPEVGGAGVTKVLVPSEGITVPNKKFSKTLNLECGNRYYVRAFATNSGYTTYGEQITFDFMPKASEFSDTAYCKYVWNGQTYPESGDYTQTLTSVNGCDSTVTLHLTILKSVTSEFSATVYCKYVWNEQTYPESGDYTQTLTSVNGCDSIVTLHLTVFTTVTTEFSDSIIKGNEYVWNEQTYTESGDYTQTFTSVNGCDSIVTLHLTVDYEYVDLGLPSGTLWATMNIGATTPEEYGDYFAWGETAPKVDYSWDTYAFGTQSNLTKYNNTDGKFVLDPEDDAAHINWGGDWRMPTRADFTELKNNCTWGNHTQNGVDGYLVTSKINGNSLFLPFAGYKENSTLKSNNSKCYCWSSNLKNALTAYVISASGGQFNPDAYVERFYGLPIRAVCKP